MDTATGAVYAGGMGVLYISGDSGITFSPYNNTHTKNPIFSIAANVYGKLLCAASDGLYSITGEAVRVPENVLRNHDALLENYPNPFSSTTTIALGEGSFTSLKIYNILGKVVADLSSRLSPFCPTGNNAITFDGSGLPAGVYVCREIGMNKIEQKVMGLVKPYQGLIYSFCFFCFPHPLSIHLLNRASAVGTPRLG